MNTIFIEQLLEADSDSLLVDVRSPKEYIDGHIPGAINVPVLMDDERAEVGTLYKQAGGFEARQRGLQMVSGRLAEMVETIISAASGRRIVVYCWRGGLRSKSVSTVLGLAGIVADQLAGGYKVYRQWVLSQLERFVLRPEIVVLCGSTGVGKTIVLDRLSAMGFPVIDLEKAANHRGSIFGHIGLGQTVTAHNFDTNILSLLKQYNDCRYIVVECESRRIGNIYLPEVLYRAMQNGKKILLTASIATRVERLLNEYTDNIFGGCGEFIDCVEGLRRKLGNKKTDVVINLMRGGDLRAAVAILLTDYYDPLYGYEKSDRSEYFRVVSAEDLIFAADAIADCFRKL